MNACKYFFMVSLVTLPEEPVHAQNFINGDFENNIAAGCEYNLQNTIFNSEMSNSFAFGAGDEIDIMSGCAPYCSAAASGNWYISLANSSGAAADAMSLALSSPLAAGSTYTLSFWDHADGSNSYSPTPLQIGVSNANNSIGTIVYTGIAPLPGIWKQHIFTFVAPVTGQYITVSATTMRWSQVDNFQVLNPLPVQMISFSAVLRSDNKVDLTWNTASEINNDYFTAEKSNDAIHFEKIEQIPGSGTTTLIHEYHSTDPQPFSGINYYRIKQTDYNGTSAYSKINVVKFNPNENSDLAFYIDKASATLRFYHLTKADKLEITNGGGITVLKISGFSGIEVDLGNFSKGIYFLRFVSGDISGNRRFVLQ